jgi:nucleoside-diphosphate-sugar epimerase
LRTLLTHPGAPGQVWMASDGEDVSTPDLVRRSACAMHMLVRLLRVPASLLRAMGSAVGRRAEMARLCGSLTVDLSRTRERLGWSPPTSVEEGLRRTVDWYLSRQDGT